MESLKIMDEGQFFLLWYLNSTSLIAGLTEIPVKKFSDSQTWNNLSFWFESYSLVITLIITLVRVVLDDF